MRRPLAVIALVVVVASVAAGIRATRSSARSDAVVPVTVTATEFRFRLTKARFARGSTVAFKLINRGAIVHDFKVKGFRRKTPVIQPGQQYTLRLTFTKAGRFTYLCTVPRHAENGMSGTFVVR